jgi:hypothetical protein
MVSEMSGDNKNQIAPCREKWAERLQTVNASGVMIRPMLSWSTEFTVWI